MGNKNVFFSKLSSDLKFNHLYDGLHFTLKLSKDNGL